MNMPENPELYGMAAIFATLVTAWTRFKPSMKKLEGEQDNSLRADLLKRIETLEANDQNKTKQHNEELKELRQEHESIINKMNERHDRIVTEYELRLKDLQKKIDMLMDALLGSTEKGNDNG